MACWVALGLTTPAPTLDQVVQRIELFVVETSGRIVKVTV